MAAHRELGLNRITGESEVLTRLPGLESALQRVSQTSAAKSS